MRPPDDEERAPLPELPRAVLAGIGDGIDGAPRARPALRPDPMVEKAARDIEARTRRDALNLLADARATIPEAFAWVAQSAPRYLHDRFSWYRVIWGYQHRLLDARAVTFFSGDSGIGKTTAAIVLLLHVLEAAAGPEASAAEVERGARARLIPERDLLPPPEAGRPSRLAEACAASVLILDDVGKASGNQYRVERTRDVLEHRFDRRQPVIMTTYLNQAEWARIYDGGNERRYYQHDPARGVYVVDLARPEEAFR